jgi:hypothetical protein
VTKLNSPVQTKVCVHHWKFESYRPPDPDEDYKVPIVSVGECIYCHEKQDFLNKIPDELFQMAQMGYKHAGQTVRENIQHYKESTQKGAEIAAMNYRLDKRNG